MRLSGVGGLIIGSSGPLVQTSDGIYLVPAGPDVLMFEMLGGYRDVPTFSQDVAGPVPGPTANDISQGKVLAANGTWVVQSGGGGGGAVAVSKTANYNVLTSDNNTYFDNNGAPGTVIFFLPLPSPALNYRFSVVTPHLVQVQATGGAVIGLGSASSIAGGNVNSPFPFSSISVYAPEGPNNQWIATSNTGGWNVN